MIYPSADKLESWGSKYSLVVLAAKRAKQIKSGAPPLVETSSRNPLTIALEEIAAGKVFCEVADHDILPKTTQEVEVAQLLAIPTLSVEHDISPDEAEALAAFSDEDEILANEDEEEEEEEAATDDEVVEEEEHFVVEAEDDEEEAEEDVEEPDILAEEPPKPKTRGRKKKEPEVVPLDEVEDIELAEEESEE